MKVDAEHLRRFDQALLAERSFNELFDLATSLRDEGVSQLAIYTLYEHFLEDAPVDDPKYDWISEVMDFIWGYPPYTKDNALFPTTLTNEEVRAYRSRA